MPKSPRSALSASLLALPLAVVFLIGLRSPARAAGLDPEPVSVKISYADVDLATAHGSAELLQRIRSAARVVCAGLDDVALDEKYLWHKCIDATVDSAVVRVGNENFTAYYLARTPATHARRAAFGVATTARASR